MLGRMVLNLAVGVAGLAAGHFLSQSIKKENPRKTITQVRVGDLIQWESHGSFVFSEPKKVENVAKDVESGSYVFVEGSRTGIPIEQVVVVRRVGDCES